MPSTINARCRLQRHKRELQVRMSVPVCRYQTQTACACPAADQRRYEQECDAYEAANPGWRAYQERRAAAKSATAAAKAPPASPPSAEDLFVEAWCVICACW